MFVHVLCLKLSPNISHCCWWGPPPWKLKCSCKYWDMLVFSWPCCIFVPCTACMLQSWQERCDAMGGRARCYFGENCVFDMSRTWRLSSPSSQAAAELYCSYLINIWYAICQSDIKWKTEALFLWCDAKCVFSVINAFIVRGWMTVTLPRQRHVKHHSEWECPS